MIIANVLFPPNNMSDKVLFVKMSIKMKAEYSIKNCKIVT